MSLHGCGTSGLESLTEKHLFSNEISLFAHIAGSRVKQVSRENAMSLCKRIVST